MKKILTYILMGLAIVSLSVSCAEDRLETAPTTAVSGSSMFDNATAALVPLNGIYAAMHMHGWTTTGNHTQAFALRANMFAADMMGEDIVNALKGGGWFYNEHTYTIKVKWNTTTWRPYGVWNQFYTYIANANYIIAAKETMQGATADVNYIVGQAYAIRGFSYFMLSQWFARTYKGHENDPCVPIYLEPSVAGTQGQPRSTVEQVYKVINADLDSASNRLKESYQHTHISHLDYYSVNGIKARVALVTNDWTKARDCAKIARSKTSVGDESDIMTGMNSTTYKNVMWGAIITEDQTDYQRNLFAHLDKRGNHGTRQPKYMNPLLYEKMGADDIRKGWFEAVADSKVDGGYHYQQYKFLYAKPETYMGDYIFMRHEEMLLTEAEAECRLGNYDIAKSILMELMSKRDENYTCTKTGTELGALTNDWTGSLLEEILIQRRIELWAEVGRIFDIRRLKQGFTRSTKQGFLSAAASSKIGNVTNPDTYAWVLPIPQKEFDGNAALDIAVDQNPLDDGI